MTTPRAGMCVRSPKNQNLCLEHGSVFLMEECIDALRTALAEIAGAFKPWAFYKKGNTIVLARAMGGDEPTRREMLELYARLNAWFTAHAAAIHAATP